MESSGIHLKYLKEKEFLDLDNIQYQICLVQPKIYLNYMLTKYVHDL
jgi:hypothetical protein